MNNQEAKDFLNGYNTAKKKYRLALENLEECETMIMNITPSYSRERVISTKNADRLAGVIDKLIALKEQMILSAEECYTQMLKVLSVVNRLDDITLYELIDRMYIQGEDMDSIAKKMNYSWQHIYRLHGEALNKVAVECEEMRKGAIECEDNLS